MRTLKNVLLISLVVFFSFTIYVNTSSAEDAFYHDIILEPGWNIISTPREVESHKFSAAEILSNFDIYLLDSDDPSGWTTMQESNQTEFTPLFGYFINNKTGSDQILTLNYETDIEPNERLFSRDIQTGWNVVGVANPSYALLQQQSNSTDHNNVTDILVSLEECIDTIIDFTADQASSSSVKIGDQWDAAVFNDADSLNDFRETKAYAVYINNQCTYQGFQNNDPVLTNTTIDAVEVNGFDNAVFIAELGEDDVLLADFTIINTSDNNIFWDTARLEDVGDDRLASNVRIEVEGIEVTNATSNGDYFEFNMGNYSLNDNSSYSVEVYGDVGIANINSTINFRLTSMDDFVFVGENPNYDINMTDGVVGTGIVVELEAGEVTINIDKNDQKTLFRNDTDNAVLAVIEIISHGEDATLEEIVDTTDTFFIETVSGTTADGDLTNIELRDVYGGVYDLTSSYAANNWTLTLDEEIYLPMGVTKTLELEVDIEDTMDNGVELRVTLEDAALQITGDESDAILNNISPSSVEGAKIEIENASLGWATEELTDETAVEGSDNVLIYVASLEAGDSSLVELKSFTLIEQSQVTNAFDDDNISTIRAYLNGELLETASGDIIGDGLASSSITFNNLGSDYREIPAGEIYTLEVYADVTNNITPGIIELGMSVPSNIWVRDVDGNEIEADAILCNWFQKSRTVTLVETGDLMVELLTNDAHSNDDVYHLAGTETLPDRYLGELEFTTINENIEITELHLGATGSAAKDDILYVILYDKEGNEVAIQAPEIDGDVEFEFSPGELVLSADRSTSFYIGIEAKSIDSESALGTADFNSSVQFYIEGVEAFGYESGDEIFTTRDSGDIVVMGEYAAATSTTMVATIVGSVITSVSSVTVADTSLGGDQIIGKYKFEFDNDDNMKNSKALEAALLQLNLTVSTSSGGVAVSGIYAYVDGQSSNVTDEATYDGGEGHFVIDFTTLDGEANLLDGEQTIVVKATVGGTIAGQWLQTKIDDITTDIIWNADNVADGTGTDYTGVRLNIEDPVGTKLD